MSKNLVLCCDGTNNEYGTRNTNVVHLFSMLVQDPATQLAYYHPGLGTMGAPGAWTRTMQWFSRLLGQAFGRGLGEDIRDAYVFLMQNHAPGDRIFLFGFSRGAYTVRALAGMLHMFGLIRKGNEPLVPYAVRMLTRRLDEHTFDVAANFKVTFSVDCSVHFVGVWDTVTSVGWFWNPVTIPYSANNPGIDIGRHAVALDERRAFFRSNLWRPPADPAQPRGPRDLKQVWFPGVHCDVGGGYLERESGLPKIALEWMLHEAVTSGLKVNDQVVDEVLGRTASGRHVPPDPAAGMHESLTAKWWAAEFVPKKHFDWLTRTTRYRPNLFRYRTVPDDSLIHKSAFQRGPCCPANTPKRYVEVD